MSDWAEQRRLEIFLEYEPFLCVDTCGFLVICAHCKIDLRSKDTETA